MGKSTFLNLVVGRLRPQQGEVLIDGKKVESLSKKELAKKISYIPQFHNLAFRFTVLDVVMMGRTAHLDYFASPKKRDQEIALEYLEEMQIAHLKNKYYTEISGGERQLVLITSALCQEAEMIILDEPCSHLDFGKSYKFIEKLKELNEERNIGILMTTHFPDHALLLGGEGIILKEKIILASGSVEETINEKNLSETYNIPIKIGELFTTRTCIVVKDSFK